MVEETANAADDFTIIPTSGEPYILQDTIGVLADNSLTWSSGGIEYYMVSDVLNQNELVEIADKKLSEVMKDAAKPFLKTLELDSDAEISDHWVH